MKTKTIQQIQTFRASPETVYQLLMDADQHAAFTGSDVTMSNEINGTFSMFGGYAHGYNKELLPGKRIIQNWHFAENGWPDDHFSTCTFEFEKDGEITTLTFTQTGVPEHKATALEDGWNQYYWEPMKTYLQESLKS